MLLSEIIFRLFALMRPLLWYYHRLGRLLEIAIAYRVREILGLAMPVRKLGIGGFHRIHHPTSLIRLAQRFDRLVARYNDIERLARLRAARLQREIDAAPVLLVADHRPQPAPPSLVVLVLVFSVFPRAASAPTGLRIRAPP